MEMRLVRNVGDRVFSDAFLGEQFTINPGDTKMVPAEAVDLWFGDNTRVNMPDRFERQEELERLRVRYGIAVRQLEATLDPEVVVNDELWPQVEVTTLDGEPVETVLSDPAGTKVTPASQTVSEKEQLLDLIRRQQADLEALREQFKRAAREEIALDAGQLVEDTPKVPASRKARAS